MRERGPFEIPLGAAGRRWPAALAVALAMLLSLLTGACQPRRPSFGGSPGMKVWVASDAEKIRPMDPPQPARVEAVLHAARAETAAFQVIVCADRRPLKGVTLRAGPLRRADGRALGPGAVRMFREAMFPISRPSHIHPERGVRGDWPDALVPIGPDPYYGETRNGAPFDVAQGRNQPVWVDVRVPDGAPAGDYRGEILVASGGTVVAVPVRLHVWDFTLPPASLPTAFRHEHGITQQHHGLTPAERERLSLLYAREGLAHRASPWGFWIYTGFMPYEYDPSHPERGARILDWSRCDRLYGAVMNGVPEGRATAMDMLPPPRTRTGLPAPTVSAAPAPELSGRLPRGSYLYRVSAVNGEGETEGSTPVVLNRTPGGAIRLSWKPVRHARHPRLSATRYNIFRASGRLRGNEVDEYPPAWFIGSTTRTDYVDTGSAPEERKRPCPEANTTSDRELLALYRAYAAHFRERGWLDRVFMYTVDEPFSRAELAKGQRQARLWREAVPDGWALCTTTYPKELDGLVNLWCVPYHWFDDPEHATASEVRRRQARGERVWWYHASLTEAEPLHRGGRWPTFVIDDSAMSARIAGFITWRYGFQGFLYYLTTMAYSDPDNDPWRNQYYFDSNGDGTLLYPGTPDRIGGTHHIPIASLRFRFFRQGMQDYEYLHRLAELGDPASAEAAARQMVPRTDGFRQDADWAELRDLRISLARRLEQLEKGRSPRP